MDPAPRRCVSALTVATTSAKRVSLWATKDTISSPAMGCLLLIFLIAYAAYHCMEHFSSDVSNAFTHNKMEEARNPREMCIELNVWEGGEYGRSWWKLGSIAYGCPDANIEWYRQVRRFFVDRCGFTRSLFFPCLFILHLEARRQILVGVATDNFEMFFSKDPKTRQAIEDLRRAMDSEWPMTHADGPDETLGIKEEQTQDGGKLRTQPSMLKKIQEHFFPDGRVPLDARNEGVRRTSLAPLTSSKRQGLPERQWHAGLHGQHAL